MNSDKEEKYLILETELKELFSTYTDLSMTAQMASLSSAIKRGFSEFTFVGFYIVVKEKNILEVGPYVSHILAVPRIDYGKGVCGTCWEQKQSQIVNNVRKCNNYIACSPDVLSEIVIPVFNKEQEVIAVLDIDSNILDRFDESDKQNLERLLSKYCISP
jgi:L-methionine (R)-S-oxide reductase